LQTANAAQRNLSGTVTFSFGRNWQDFVSRYLTPERESIAIRSLTDFLEQQDLRGLSFLDIGCGSGLFSLAAVRLGAQKIVSLDVDPFSYDCTQSLRQTAGSPSSWQVIRGSILDNQCASRIEPANIVYAWGSLHHTGNMWQAIRNACKLVVPGGLLCLGIYNKMEGRHGSRYWLRIKKLYNRCPTVGKRVLEVAYVLRHQVLPNLIRLKHPFASWRNYHQARGMNPWIDVRDWLGGFPYEFASIEEVFRFCSREMGLHLVNLRAADDIGVNEFLFRK
jgi:2-polyprenyl-3-methyl-5-hydroxy-6-metoxy-1,4-benzoquinol methylase